MTIRKTLLWTMVLLASAAAGGAFYAYDLWTQREELLRAQIVQALAERVPDWDLQFDAVDMDWREGIVRLEGVTLKPRGGAAQLVQVPELVITTDRTMLARHQRIVVTFITIKQPTVWLTRSAAGRWNWQDLTPPPHSEAPCPEVAIQDGTIIVHLDRGEDVPETEFQCRAVDGRLIPSGLRRFLIEAATDLDHAGTVNIGGALDLKSGAWSLRGDVAAIDTNDGLLDVAAGLSPEVRTQLERLSPDEQSPRGVPREIPVSGPGRTPVHDTRVEERGGIRAAADRRGVSATRAASSEFTLPELGVQAQLDLHFEVSRTGTGAALDYFVTADIHDGQIVNPALPVSLHNLGAKIRVSNTELVIDDFSATNGESVLRISGRMTRVGSLLTKDFSIQALNLELDRRVRDYLHNESWRRMYDTVSPAGRFSLDVHVAHDGADRWDVTLNEFTALRCSLEYAGFQYPITEITGAVRQAGEAFHVELQGRAGTRPVFLTGAIRHPGPAMEIALRLRADDVPLDRRFVEALRLDKLQQVRRAMDVLHLEGLANVDAAFLRAAGPGQKFLLQLHADVHDAQLAYERFPYVITNLSGTIDFDPLKENVWHFRNLRGEHNGAVLTAFATFDLRQPPGQLNLNLSALQAALDADLRQACATASDSLRTAWDIVNPSGLVDVTDAELVWVPGGTPVVALPAVKFLQAGLVLQPLPYRWENVAGTAGWRDGTVTIEWLTALHGNTKLEIIGTGAPDTAYVEIAPRDNVAWHVHLDDVRIRQLVCDEELVQALPRGMADVVTAMDPRGPLDIDVGIDLKGAMHQPDLVTAHWGMQVQLHGNHLFAGVQLEDVHGSLEISDGVWDGTAVTADGFVRLVSVRALDLPLKSVHGPFAIDGGQITVGTPRWTDWLVVPVHHSDANLFAGQQLQADELYADAEHAGRIGVDGVVHLESGAREQTQYRCAVKLQDASLRQWARDPEWFDDPRTSSGQLRGSVNGEVDLVGRGTSSRDIRGKGWVQIWPAALYELPVFAQIFPILNFKSPDKTAFKYAYGEFTLHSGKFDFSAIDLRGDAGRMVGKGTAEYSDELQGRLNFDFFSKADDRLLGGIGQIPILRMAFNNWVQIHVDGTIDKPVVMQQPGGIPAEILKDLLQDIEQITLPINPFGVAPGRTPPNRSGGGAARERTSSNPAVPAR